jgi:hypothetical protein
VFHADVSLAFFRGQFFAQPAGQTGNIPALYPDFSAAGEFADETFPPEKKGLPVTKAGHLVVKTFLKGDNMAGVNYQPVFDINCFNAAIAGISSGPLPLIFKKNSDSPLKNPLSP